MLCLTFVAAGDLSQISHTSSVGPEYGNTDASGYSASQQLSAGYGGSYAQSPQLSSGYGGGAAYSQQSINIGSYGNSIGNYGDQSGEQGGYDYSQNGYQVQDLSSNHIGDTQGQYGGQFEASAVDITDGGIQSNYGNGFQANLLDNSGGYGHSGGQVIHTQAEAIPISKHVEITKSVPYPVYKQLHVPGDSHKIFKIFKNIINNTHNYELNRIVNTNITGE